MKITIQRSQWVPYSFWNLEKDCGCAMGHLLMQADGFTKDELYLLQVKVFSKDDDPELFQKLELADERYRSSGMLPGQVMSINDNYGLTLAKKEELLTEEFAKGGYELEFVD